MSLVTGIFCFLDNGKYAIMEDNFMVFSNSVNQQLRKMFDDNERYYLSLDQSTTCTGISIRNTEETVLCQMDFMRLQTPKEVYFTQLEKLVSHLVKDLRLSLIVIENPIPVKNSKATPVLFKLAKDIKGWKDSIPEFYGVPFDTIYPQQWKEKVLDKKKGKYRYGVKAEIAKDVSDIFPLLNNYRVRCLACDFDSFDATGIMSGYLRQHFDEDGNKVNFGSAVYNSKMHIFVKYLPSIEIKNTNLIMEGIPKKMPIEMLQYNSDKSFYDNLRMACSGYPVSCFSINDQLTYLNMLWESKESFNRNYNFVCVVARQGYMTESQLRKAQKTNTYFYMA